ncbi:PaaI family thioesterase [Bacillus sp. DJP31]|uniref:PaaI family thioesterase n=1 Tax=Bacillus sp. DJP31 TaxID=3409789 RepID=UPI003BB63A61
MTANQDPRIRYQSLFSDLLGFQAISYEKGNVILQLQIEDYHKNSIGTVHGGVIATMIDNIIGATITSLVSLPSTTINLNISYTKPAVDGLLIAKATILQQGYRIVTGEGIITDQDDQMIAKGTGTFKILHSK